MNDQQFKGVNGTNKLGLGLIQPKKKFKYPEGHRVFKLVTTSFYDTINLITTEQFDDGNRVLLGCKNGALYGEGKSLVFIKQIKGQKASRSWSVAGSNPRLYVDATFTRYLNTDPILVEDTYSESPSCDPLDQLISKVEISNEIRMVDPSASFAPNCSISLDLIDEPTVSTNCLKTAYTEVVIILPEGSLSKVGLPAFNNSTLYELIDGDFKIIDSI